MRPGFLSTCLCTFAALLATATVSTAVEINVFAAASLTDALKEIAANFEKASANKIVFNFGASSTLARQIDEGAPADIFFSADEAKMDGLQKSGLIVNETRKRRLSNSLVVVIPSDSSLVLRSPSDLTNASIRRIALADPAVVPAGVYSRLYLEKLGIWSVLKPKVVPTENVRGALAAVASGDVEAGMVYKTDAAISRKVKIACEVPRADGPDISYPVALMKDSSHPDAARKFLEYLESPAAGKVFKEFGFIVRE